MRIITDSAADFTREELEINDVRCVPMQVIFGEESFTADKLSPDAFWQRLLAGEIGKTSQPSPDAFHTEFEAAQKEETVAEETTVEETVINATEEVVAEDTAEAQVQ